jgi:hypothetical protein
MPMNGLSSNASQDGHRSLYSASKSFGRWVGRRGGKTRSAAALAVFLAALCDHRDSLVVGERGIVLCIAQNQRQAAVAFNYAAGIFDSVPMLGQLVSSRTADTLSLSTGIDLEVRAASFRGLRGVTAVACLADECAFWYSDDASANADTEILNAVRPALATTGGPLICISSPHARRGEMYATHKRHFGSAGDRLILVAQGASRDFNPSLPQSVVDRAYERDAAVASAEFGGVFRADLEAFVSREVVEAAVDVGALERAPLPDITYHAFVDPSGGAKDAMTVAIAHCEGRVLTLDAVRERKPPFSPESVVADFAALLERYRISTIRGDRYAGEWPRERFQVHGITYLPTDRNRSEIYCDLLPELNSKSVALLDSPRLAAQLCGLERRTSRGGRDVIDHPPGSHDDLANAVAGALLLAKPGAVVDDTEHIAAAAGFGPVFGTYDGAYENNPATISRLQRGRDPWAAT